MFRNAQLDRIEKYLGFLHGQIESLPDYHAFLMLRQNATKTVSPAKKPAKRKYVRSGKYAKVTTKKK